MCDKGLNMMSTRKQFTQRKMKRKTEKYKTTMMMEEKAKKLKEQVNINLKNDEYAVICNTMIIKKNTYI